MKIYTGYFAKLKQYTEAGLCPVSIALSQPKWLSVQLPILEAFFPDPKTLRWSKNTYTSWYKYHNLANLDPKPQIMILEALAEGKDVVLMCWEKPSDFCHRQLVAEWFNKHTDYHVEEWYKEKPVYDRAAQPDLFGSDAFQDDKPVHHNLKGV